MGQVTLMNYPIKVIGEHNDSPTGQVVDDFGTHDVFTITSLQWNNLVDISFTIRILDANLKTFVYSMIPYETGAYNIPTPQRIASYPTMFNVVIER